MTKIKEKKVAFAVAFCQCQSTLILQFRQQMFTTLLWHNSQKGNAVIKLLRTSSAKRPYLFVDEYSTDEVISSQIIELVREDLRHLGRADADLTVQQIITQLNGAVLLEQRLKSNVVRNKVCLYVTFFSPRPLFLLL